MKRILIPTDFSQNAFNALRYAVNLFDREKCTFYLLNTYTPVVYDFQYMLNSYSSPDLTESYKSTSERNLKRLKGRISKEFSLSNHQFFTISSFNNLTQEIKDQVMAKRIDLVVMGTKGATGAKELLFGSNTVHAMQKLTCPLLAIPSHCKFKIPENLLFPSDFELDLSKDPLQIVREILLMTSSRLNILSVDFGVPLKEYQIQQKNLLEEYFSKPNTCFHSISKKSVPEAIKAFQETHPTDLLVMVNNKHSFFENLIFQPVINQIGFHVKIPFLVLPSTGKQGNKNTPVNLKHTCYETYPKDPII